MVVGECNEALCVAGVSAMALQYRTAYYAAPYPNG